MSRSREWIEHDGCTCFFAKELKESYEGIVISHFEDVKSVGKKATNNKRNRVNEASL